MDDADKKKVLDLLWSRNYRLIAFSEEDSAEMEHWYNDTSGWTQAWKIQAQKVENKYCRELVKYFDDDDNGVNNYQETLV